MCRCEGTGLCAGFLRIVRGLNWRHSEPVAANVGCSRQWAERRRIYIWGPRKSGEQSLKICADEKGTGCWKQLKRWPRRRKRIGECGVSAGKIKSATDIEV